MREKVLVLFTLMVFMQYGESRYLPSWFPENIIDSVSNKTSLVKEYVRERGRNLKQFYVDNVRNKITSYFVSDTDKDLANREMMFNDKFKDFIEELHDTNSTKVFDNIGSDNINDDNVCKDKDPSIFMTTPQLIALHGYAAESHAVLTDDGYLLTIHRIPLSKHELNRNVPRRTVLLHHGVLGSSADWVLAGPEKSLAYILSDAGYDVWMANVRGNTYSRAHKSLNVDDSEFWNFSFHDVSQHDLPAIIDYIMKNKGSNEKINYIGHSMGTTVLFALLSTKTHYNSVLRAGFALAPVAYMTEIKSPVKLLAKFADNIEFLVKLIGAGEFLPRNAFLRWLSKHACGINIYEEMFCDNSFFALCGHGEKHFNSTLLPMILGHVPAGTSSKTLVHYSQEIRSDGRFQQFDYGPQENLKHYGTKVPPEYAISNITLPIALFSAEKDWLASDIDVTKLYFDLPNPIDHYIVPSKDFNHIDFLWAGDAPKLVFKKLLELLETKLPSDVTNGVDSKLVQ